MTPAIEAVSASVVIITAALIKSAHNGRIRDALDARKESKQLGDRAHSKIEDRLDDIHQTVHRTDDRVDNLATAFVVVNEQRDDVDVSELREDLGVDHLDSDYIKKT